MPCSPKAGKRDMPSFFHLCCVKGAICGNAAICNDAPACMSLRMRAGASCFRRAAPSAFCWCLVCSRIESAQNSYYFHLAIDPIYGEEAARFPWGNRGRCRFPAKEMGFCFQRVLPAVVLCLLRRKIHRAILVFKQRLIAPL